jgi:hypothetical protein
MVTNRAVNNIIRIPVSLDTNFFRAWVEILTPIHNLCNREKDVLAALLKARFELSKEISDQNILDRVTLSNETREKVQKETGVSSGFYQVILGNLRKAKIIDKNGINKKLIPKDLHPTDDAFQAVFYFDLNAGNIK